MAIWDAVLSVDFGINDYGEDEVEAEVNLRDSLPPEVNDAIDTLADSGYADLSWSFERIDREEFSANFWRGKRGE